jgi:integrase
VAKRKTDRLTQVEINRLTNEKQFRAGLWPDGSGLYLNVSEGGTASWIFRYMLTGSAHVMGLGAYPLIGLKAARDRRDEKRRMLLDGIDPLGAKRDDKARKAAERAAQVTFKAAAEAYIKAHRASWKSEKHAWQWTRTLEMFVYPLIGALPVAAIDTAHITKILQPIWETKPETATRVRGRIETVLDFAKANKWRAGENPAAWKGNIEHALPPRAKVAKVVHHPALPWREIGAFTAELETQEGVAPLALRFAILTAARTNEVIGAKWSEIDTRPLRRVTIGRDDKGEPITDTIGAAWTVPANRMKAGKEHRVPLSEPALAVLEEAAKLRQGKGADGPIFPGGNGGKSTKGLSNLAMLMLIRRMNKTDGAPPPWRDETGEPIVPHGFRSTFRDWCADATAHPNHVAEQALAHAISSAVEASYRRGDLFEKRRRLMDDWGAFCGRVPSADGDNVVSIRPVEVVA